MEQNKKEILIDGYIYDVHDFKHPGGTVIDFYVNSRADAGFAFKEFHQRSKKAQLVLKGLKSRKAEEYDMLVANSMNLITTNNMNDKMGGENGIIRRNSSPLSSLEEVNMLNKDFEQFRKDLLKEGYFKPSISHTTYRVLEILCIFTLGYYLMLQNNLLCIFMGILLHGIAQGRCGWLMHEAGHYSLTGNIRTDRLIQEFFYGIGCGMSASWWRSQHNKHHATPQKLNYDVDLNTLPLLAFNKEVLKNKNTTHLNLFWIKYQAYLFFPFTSLVMGLGWTLFLHPRHVLRKKLYSEMCFIMLRYLSFVSLLIPKYTIAQIFFMYMFTFITACNYIFINFAVSHSHLPVTKESDYMNWVVYSSLYTTNIQSNAFCDWWMSFLNFQIEHHLFPSMPQFRHKLISHRVKRFFEKHNLVYDVRPYWSAIYDTFINMNNVSKHLHLKI